MKTTLEIPDSIFRRAKSVAAQRGVALRVFVTEAVEEKLAATSRREQKPWVGWRVVSNIFTKRRRASTES
jgi:hypothetical protein